MVNIGNAVNIARELDARALQILRGLPGVDAVVEPVADTAADAVLRLADRELPIAIKVRSRVNAATARQLVEGSVRAGGVSMLVVADETTADARVLLREHGIGLVDADGYAHVELPGVLIHTEGASGDRDGRKADRPARLSGKAGVVAQALLVEPERTWKVADLAGAAGVSSGLAHRVLARLEQEGVVDVEGAGPGRVRHVADAAALLDLWAEEQQDKTQHTRAYLLGQTSALVAERLCVGLDDAGIGYALTGPAAASMVAPFVTAVPVVDVWIAATADPDRVCVAVGAEPVSTGHNIVFRQARNDLPLVFRQCIDDRSVVNPFRLYLDLRANPQRGVEQAAHLRREVIGF